MLSKRIIAITPERNFQKKLSAGLMAAGAAVETVASTAELAAKPECDLVVFHGDAANSDGREKKISELLAKTKPETPLITLIPTSDLEYMITLLKEPRINNVMVADDLRNERLSAVVTKLLYGDVFGLEKYMPWGVRIYSMLVGDYQEKSVAIAQVSDFATAMGVRRKYRESVEQVIDELLMNALYDAPVDRQGKPLFADVPTKSRIQLRMEQKAVIQYACDGDRFAVSVRDAFGALTKETVVKFIDKCLHSAEQIDRKVGGAGLGLYIIANASSEVHINLYPGVATEMVCIFDLSVAKVQCKTLAFYTEKIDAVGRLAGTGMTKISVSQGGRPAPQPGWMRATLMASVVMFLLAVGVVVYNLATMAGSGALTVSSNPPAAEVFVDNVSKGRTPLKVDDIPAKTYAVRVHLDGYQDWNQPVQVSEGKAPTPVKADLVRQTGVVRITSNPPGARVFIGEPGGAQRDMGVTPTTLTGIPTGEQRKVSLKLIGYTTFEESVTSPQPGQESAFNYQLKLAAGYGVVKVATKPPGAVLFINDIEQPPSPDGVVLKSGTYDVTVRLSGYIPHSDRVTVGGARTTEVAHEFSAGGRIDISSNVEARVFVDNRMVGKTPISDLGLSAGVHTISLRAKDPYLRYDFRVPMKKNESLSRSLVFGTVKIGAPDVVIRALGAEGQDLTEAMFPAGPAKVTLSNKDGASTVKTVDVPSGGTVTITSF